MKKLAFHDQRHGKIRFLGLSKVFVFIVKKIFFLSKTLLYLISSLILSENKKMKKLPFYDQKHGKIRFLGLSKVFVFIVKKSFFSV